MKYLVNIFEQLGGTIHPISKDYRDSEGNRKYPTNITVASYKDRLVTNTRLTDYAYIPIYGPSMIQYTSNKREWMNMISCNAIEDNEERFKTYELLGNTSTSLNNGVNYHGLEDVRLVVWNDTLYGIGFRPDVIPNRVIPQLIEFDDEYNIIHSWTLDTGRPMEKNWQPIVDKPFTFMYDPATPTTITLDMEKLKEEGINNIEAPEFTGRLCGSSQLIKLSSGGYISICHTSHKYRGHNGYMYWMYNHYFVVYNDNLDVIWMSQPWRFTNDRLEFCCGMTEHDENIYITFSVYDGTTHMMSISKRTFEGIISNMMQDGSVYESQPNDSYMKRCYETHEIASVDKVIYLMALEQSGELTKPDDIIGVVDMYESMIQHRKGLILYFMTRHRENKNLIEYYDKLN